MVPLTNTRLLFALIHAVVLRAVVVAVGVAVQFSSVADSIARVDFDRLCNE